MTQPKVGVGSFIGFSEQVGYTTRIVPTTKFLPMVAGGDSVNSNENRIETGGIDSIGFSSTRYRRGSENVEGSVSAEITYQGAELLFKHLFGAVATTQPDPSNAPNVYDHTFTIADVLPLGLTLELNRGGTSFYVTGANIQSAELALGIDQYLTLAMTIIGREMATGTASSSSIPTTNAFAAPDTVVRWNNNEMQVSNVTLTINNNMDPDRFFLGSRLKKQPVRGSRLEVTASFEAEFTDQTLWDDFKNATQREFFMSAVGDTIEGGFFNEFNLTLPISVLQAVPINVSDEGRITFTAEMKSYRSSSANEATLVIRNGLSSV
jgi:hypothetical protein